MKKILALVLCLCALFTLVACNNDNNDDNTPAPVEADYKLGMGIVVNMDESATGNAQVDATVATVVTDKDGKIVACRIDAAQNKMTVTDGAVDAAATFLTKMEKGDDYNMAKFGQSMDWNGDGVVKEWYEQAKAFEAYVVGKTVAEVEAMTTKQAAAEGKGAEYQISTDDALLAAGCTIQIADFRDAVVKACKDEQGMSFKTAATFTLGVAAKTTAEESTAATAEADGVVKMYTDFAASVVVDGKIVASLNDAIQPNITISAAGEIVNTAFTATKRELKEAYDMAKAVNFGMDWNGDGKVLEWYLQSAEFSKFVVGKTAAEVSALTTKQAAAEGSGAGYQIAADEALLTAGCTIQISGIKAVVAQSVTNAR